VGNLFSQENKIFFAPARFSPAFSVANMMVSKHSRSLFSNMPNPVNQHFQYGKDIDLELRTLQQLALFTSYIIQ
jgi:hypothetical protein